MNIHISEEDFRVIIRCMYIARAALDDEANGVKSAPIQAIEETYHRLGEAFNAATAEASQEPAAEDVLEGAGLLVLGDEPVDQPGA